MVTRSDIQPASTDQLVRQPPHLARVAGAVVLYNTPPERFDRIASYLTQVEKLYVIDNSDQPNTALIEQLSQHTSISYHSNGGNQGVAHALNVAARLALRETFDFLLTMDDDTTAPPGMIQAMLTFLDTYENRRQVGILSAAHRPYRQPKPSQRVLYTLTSGNLLNLNAWQQVGPFQEELFIDHIDHEYGLRLNSHQFEVIELPGIVLDHPLGELRRTKLFNLPYVSHHPIRNYYMVRNGIGVARQYFTRYPDFSQVVATLIAKEIVKVIFLEKSRLKRMKLISQGFIDALRNRYGKYGGAR